MHATVCLHLICPNCSRHCI